MAELLPVPEVAAGAVEVVLSEWLVEPGQEFRAGDAIAVLETEKAVVEVEADRDATLLKALAPPGVSVAVGTPMALLGSQAEFSADLDALLADLGAQVVSSGPVAERREVPETPPQSPEPVPAPPQSPPPAPPQPTGATGARRFVSPIARKLLREAGVDAADVVGTGPGGRVRRRDAEAAIAAARAASAAALDVDPRPTPSASATEAEGVTRVPHTRLRRAVASRLIASKQEIPHFYLKRSAVIDALVRLRAELNAHSPVKFSINDFIIRAVAVAHRAVPAANVVWTEEAMLQFESVDIAVAVASERGLVTPVLRGVENRSLSSISTAVKEFVEQANAGRLQQKDLEGGSISITNLGMYGVEEFSAIINPPQSAILAVGAGAAGLRVVDGEPTVVTSVNLVLSVDHRAMDGALAAQWMAALVDALEHPLQLLV